MKCEIQISIFSKKTACETLHQQISITNSIAQTSEQSSVVLTSKGSILFIQKYCSCCITKGIRGTKYTNTCFSANVLMLTHFLIFH